MKPITYWHVGKRIVEQEQAGKERAKYGQTLIEALADENARIWYMNEAQREDKYFKKNTFLLFFYHMDGCIMRENIVERGELYEPYRKYI